MAEIHIVKVTIAPSGEAVLTCAFCEGAGGVPSTYRREYQKPCPVCKGSGKVLVEFEREPFAQCGLCEGKGGVPSSYRREYQTPCSSCQGIGARPVAGSWRVAT
jgi:DnaJ-class molecular chaperone